MKHLAVLPSCVAFLLLAAVGAPAQEPPVLRIQEHSTLLGMGRAPVLAAIEGGGFLAAWEVPGPSPGHSTIAACRFAAEGARAECKEIGPDLERDARQPVVSAARSGNLVVGWKEGDAIKARRFGGSPENDLTVTSCCAGGFDLAATADGFIAVWEAIPGVPSGLTEELPFAGLLGQRFTWGEPGSPEDAVLLAPGLNGERLGDPVPPRVKLVGGDTLIVSWGGGGVIGDVFLRAFDKDWVQVDLPAGDPERGVISLFEAGLQRRPALAARGLHDFRVVWDSGPPEVKIDLALCLDGREGARSDPEVGGVDRFSLELAGVSAALADSFVVPTNESLRLGVLRFGGSSIKSLLGGPRLELRRILGPSEAYAVSALLRQLADEPPSAFGEGSTAARCLCTATALLSGGANPCPRSDEDLCLVPPRDPPTGVTDQPRKVILLATGSLPCLPPPVSPFYCRPSAAEESCQLRGAARLARQQGVTTINVLRWPDSGSELARLSMFHRSPGAEPRIDLCAAAFSANPEGESGFVAEAREAGDFVEAFGRTLSAEEGAESGIFARFIVPGRRRFDEIQVNRLVLSDQSAPDVALDPQPKGTTFVVWVDHKTRQLRGQFFGPQGESLGSEVTVAEEVAKSVRPRVAALGEERFVVIWDQSTSGSEPTSVFARLLEPRASQARGR